MFRAGSESWVIALNQQTTVYMRIFLSVIEISENKETSASRLCAKNEVDTSWNKNSFFDVTGLLHG
jgi:hypothetical protein